MQEELKKVSALTEDFANELYYNPDEIYNEYVFDEGEKSGIKKGEKLGIKKGIQQGMKQGIKLREQEIIKSMMKLNTPIDDIVKITGLSKKEIIALK